MSNSLFVVHFASSVRNCKKYEMFPCLKTTTLYEVNNGYSIFIISISDHEWQLICFDAFFYSLQRTIKNEHFNNANRFSLQAFSRVSIQICCTKSELYNKYLICYTNKSPQGLITKSVFDRLAKGYSSFSALTYMKNACCPVPRFSQYGHRVRLISCISTQRLSHR